MIDCCVSADMQHMQEFDSELKKAEQEIASEEKDLLSNIDDIGRPWGVLSPAGCLCPGAC